MNISSSPVLIIGAGPVGLSLAIALIKQGVRVELFEAQPELSGEIRASTFHPATLEMFAEWGVVDHVLANGEKVDRLCYWERQTKERIAEFKYSAIANDTTFPFRLQCPQSVLTRTLRPLVEQSPLASVHMAHELITFRDFGDEVEATFHTPGGTKIVRGSYLCGADGAKSVVRQELRLGFEGMTYKDRFLLVGTDLDLRPYYPDICPVNYMYDPEEWVIVLQLPDVVRLVFRLSEDEKAAVASQEMVVRRRIAHLLAAEADYRIHSISIYRVHQRVADAFRVGRVLLLGDAAHINNPSGGMGMNSGIHDAHCLAPRLTAVLGGHSDHILDEYSELRKTVALNLVKKFSDKNYKDLAANDESYRRQRNESMKLIAEDPELARAYLLQASMLDGRI